MCKECFKLERANAGIQTAVLSPPKVVTEPFGVSEELGFGKTGNRARRYWRILAGTVVWIAIPAGVLRWLAPKEVADLWGAFQWTSVFLLWLTIPVSFVWGIVAVLKKEWKATGYLALALIVPPLAMLAALAINFKVLDSG